MGIFINFLHSFVFMVSIIGAGPVGNYAAYLLAQQGFPVNVYEEHTLIGRPIQCTGITTLYLKDVLHDLQGSEEFIVNTIDSTRVYSPDESFVDIPLQQNFIVDRALFDQYIGHLAESAGATYHYSHKFLRCSLEKDSISLTFAQNTVHDDILIGADGPSSLVARSVGIYGNRSFAIGVQARVALNTPVDPHVVEFFLDEGYFGWLVPENRGIARVGVASRTNAKQYFDRLMIKRPGKTLEWQSGVIPVYNPKLRTEHKGVYLIGDAATQVKASTYGGIIPGMMAAEELCTALTHHQSYERLWKKRIGRELWLHLKIRQMMDKFKAADFDKLIRLVNQPKIRDIISTHDREFPSKILFKMLLKEPRFLGFLPSLF